MSEGAPAVPALPHVFRPKWGRRVPLVFALVFLVGACVLAVVIPGWPPEDRVLMVLLGVAAGAFLHRLSAVRIAADESGLTVVNVRGRRRLAWAEVLDVHLSQDDAWLVLDLSDGTALQAMGVQLSDGDYSQRQALQLARLVARGSRPA